MTIKRAFILLQRTTPTTTAVNNPTPPQLLYDVTRDKKLQIRKILINIFRRLEFSLFKQSL